MSIEPKISTKQDVDILRRLYVEQKMSTVDIERHSDDMFGQYVSRGTIYKALIHHNIPVRSKSESVSRAMSTLNIEQTYINDEIIEWIDGLMLGDGCIRFKKNTNYMGARISLGSSSKQWTEYSMLNLADYNPSSSQPYQKIDKKHPNQIWESSTKSHPDIIKQANRWYCGKNETKTVPQDVMITPTSVMLWYLGDGSFTYNANGNIPQLRLATCSFSARELNLLIEKMKKKGIYCTVYKSKMDIHIRAESIKDFFNFIGWESPISCYNHKFDIPEWLKLIRLSEIVNNDKEKWRLQYYCKTGKLECSKSPGGKMLLFTREQAEKARNILA